MAAIMSVDVSERAYADHWQAVKGQSDSGAKQEALRKLNALLIERDHDLRRYKEKYEQSEKVLKRTQQQLDNLLKKQYQQQCSPTEPLPSVSAAAPDLVSIRPVAVATAAFATGTAPAGQVVSLQPVEPVSAADGDVAKPRAPATTNNVGLTCRGSARNTTSQSNCLLVSHPEPTTVTFSSSSELASAAVQSRPLPQESGFDEFDGSCTTVVTDTPWASIPNSTATTVGRPQPKWPQPELQQQQPLDRCCTSLPVTSCGSLPVGVGLTSLQQLATQPTVSVAVLKNLVKENLRMKKIIDEMKLKEGGADAIHKLMDAAETERLVSKLKQELETKQRLVDELQNALAVGGRFGDHFQQNMNTNVTVLENKVEKLNRLVETKQRTIMLLNDSLQKAGGADGSVTKECSNCCAERKAAEALRKSQEQLVKDYREEIGVLKAQMQLYHDDFAAEHQEKERLRKDYEVRLAQSAAFINQLKAQLQTAGQEIPQYRVRSDHSHRTVAQESRSASSIASAPRSAGPLLTSAYCFSAASPGVKNDYACPQCHMTFSTQSAFQNHTDACLKGNK